jgi:RimJ/RimL family protein N-acetyltransferase
MVSFRDFRPDDLGAIELQAGQRYMDAVPDWRHQGAGLTGWSAEADGKLLGCAGFAHPWEGRAVAWAVISRHVQPRHFLRIHNFVRARIADLEAVGMRRIEADCMAGFLASSRWLLALGFEIEGRAKRFSPDGRDFLRWARVA